MSTRTKLAGMRCLTHHQEHHVTKNTNITTFFVHCSECGLDLRLHCIKAQNSRRTTWLADWWLDGDYHEVEYPIEIISELGKLVELDGPLEPPPYLVAQVEEII